MPQLQHAQQEFLSGKQSLKYDTLPALALAGLKPDDLPSNSA